MKTVAMPEDDRLVVVGVSEWTLVVTRAPMINIVTEPPMAPKIRSWRRPHLSMRTVSQKTVMTVLTTPKRPVVR